MLSKFLPIFTKSDAGVSYEEVSQTNFTTIDNVVGKTRNTIIMQTATLDVKILPTTKLYLEKKYQDCKHTIKNEVELPVEMINLTKDELVKKYPEWTVKVFSQNEIVLYKLEKGLCDQHFVLNDEDGVVVVYKLDEDYNKCLYEKTDIYTEYLPEEDISRLKEGIYVYTISNLNSELENFE